MWGTDSQRGQKISFAEARAFFEERLAKDQGKVVQSLALRAAQVKHVVSRLAKHAEQMGDAELAHVLESHLPPMSEQKLLKYAAHTHQEWTEKIVPLLQRRWGENLPSSIQNWLTEAEEVLIDMRRITVQGLSKHPAVKPNELAENMADQMILRRQMMVARQSAERDAQLWENALVSAQQSLELLSQHRGFDTFTRLQESFHKLTQEKTARTHAWLETWSVVRPCLEYLNEHAPRFSEMENAQMRMLQWYLANPLNAVQRDVHGAGLVMLLRVAVDSLPEISNQEKREEISSVLENALQEESFVLFFEQLIQLDEAIRWNVNAYQEHELFSVKVGLESKIAEAQRGIEESLRVAAEHLQAEEAISHVIEKLQKELNELCVKNWGVAVEF